MKRNLLALGAALTLVTTGCETQVVDHKQYGPDGTLTSSTYSKNGKVYDDLKRILEKESYRARGEFASKEGKHLARRGALLAAEADLASTVGKVIQTRNETLYNNQIYSVLRTEGSNVIKGYDIISENWDEAKGEYSVIIEGRGYKIAEEIHKYIK